MNLIAINVDQFWVLSIIKLIERLEKIELGLKLVLAIGRGQKSLMRNIVRDLRENF